jgi:hypothetical protein
METFEKKWKNKKIEKMGVVGRGHTPASRGRVRYVPASCDHAPARSPLFFHFNLYLKFETSVSRS